MARRRIMNFGPTVSPSGRVTVSDVRSPARRGVILRNPPGGMSSRTTKSELRPRVWKGIRPPGDRPLNFPSPMN